MVCMDVWSKAKKCLTLTSPHPTSTHRSHKSIHRGEFFMYPSHTCNSKVNTFQTRPLWDLGLGSHHGCKLSSTMCAPKKGNARRPLTHTLECPWGESHDSSSPDMPAANMACHTWQPHLVCARGQTHHLSLHPPSPPGFPPSE
jgi:hypothetical protein